MVTGEQAIALEFLVLGLSLAGIWHLARTAPTRDDLDRYLMWMSITVGIQIGAAVFFLVRPLIFPF